MAESLARNLIRLIVTVAILGAVYLFLLKPVLDTTETAFESVNGVFGGPDGVAKQIDAALDAANVQDLQIDLDSRDQAQRMLRCVQRAGGDAARIERCSRRISR
jgi:hypothetical protein